MSISPAVVAKCVFGGTFGAAGAPDEIWSTSFHVAAFGEGNAGGSMGTFDPESYLTNQVIPFATAVMGITASNCHLTFAKCNQFRINAGSKGSVGPHQVQQETVENLALNVSGQGNNFLPNFVSFGWGLQTTGGSRGRATHGRMFLPPAGSSQIAGNGTLFDADGSWSDSVVASANGVLSPAWAALRADDSLLGNGNTFLPALVSVPKVPVAGGPYLVNQADITIAEQTPWVMRSRKSAEPSGGTKVDHSAAF